MQSNLGRIVNLHQRTAKECRKFLPECGHRIAWIARISSRCSSGLHTHWPQWPSLPAGGFTPWTIRQSHSVRCWKLQECNERRRPYWCCHWRYKSNWYLPLVVRLESQWFRFYAKELCAGSGVRNLATSFTSIILILRSLNRSWLKQKDNSRLVFVKRAHVYHSGRVYMHALYRRRSAFDDKMLDELVELSLSPYTRIRRWVNSFS